MHLYSHPLVTIINLIKWSSNLLAKMNHNFFWKWLHCASWIILLVIDTDDNLSLRQVVLILARWVLSMSMSFYVNISIYLWYHQQFVFCRSKKTCLKQTSVTKVTVASETSRRLLTMIFLVLTKPCPMPCWVIGISMNMFSSYQLGANDITIFYSDVISLTVITTIINSNSKQNVDIPVQIITNVHHWCLFLCTSLLLPILCYHPLLFH